MATERARIARDIHDELGANLTKIHKAAEMMNHSGRNAGRIDTYSKNDFRHGPRYHSGDG